MNKVVEELSKIGIVPVIALDDAKDAEPLAKALIEGRTSMRRSNIQNSSSRGIYPYHG